LAAAGQNGVQSVKPPASRKSRPAAFELPATIPWKFRPFPGLPLSRRQQITITERFAGSIVRCERFDWKCANPTAGKRQTASLKASSTTTD
jgi:hypothetical protein